MITVYVLIRDDPEPGEERIIGVFTNLNKAMKAGFQVSPLTVGWITYGAPGLKGITRRNDLTGLEIADLPINAFFRTPRLSTALPPTASPPHTAVAAVAAE